ncbi:RYamide receptor [Nymphon striatum]|nr:RYamide receptor [Nymphon striatum]
MDQEFVNITNTSYEDILHPPIEILNAVGKPLQTFLITLYSFTAIFSFAGNITVICVMIGGRRSSRDLRYLLTNLALSDIMMAIFCIPFTYTEVLLNRWIFSIKFCPIVQFLQHCTVTSSVYTLTVIGIDRFYAVMYPLKVSWIRSHTILVIFGIWLMSAAFSVYVLISTKVEPFDWGGRMYYQCIESDSKAFAIAAFLLAFFIPLIILAFCYTIIAIKLYRRNAPGNVDAQRDQRQNQTKIKILKMLVLIVALFGFCWLPLHVFSVLVHFFPKFTVFSTEKSQNIFVGAYFVLHWIAMSHSFANPLIYSFMCENFRVIESKIFDDSYLSMIVPDLSKLQLSAEKLKFETEKLRIDNLDKQKEI